MIDTHWDVFAELFVKQHKHINGSLFCPLICICVFICDRKGEPVYEASARQQRPRYLT